jgi:protein required for attachment to host cells
MHAPHTWIVVADGAVARFYSLAGPAAKIEPALPYELRHPNPASRNQGTDHPGRVHESSGVARHAVEPRVDPHRESKRTFAREIAELLAVKTREKSFERLVIVAPPQMMGDLRAALDDATKACIKAEIAKDLTHLSAKELLDHLRAETML